MVTPRYLLATLAICAAFSFAVAEESKEETGEVKPLAGLFDGILGAADGAKDKMEGEMDVLISYTSVEKEPTEEGVKKAPSFAENMGDSFSKSMGKVTKTDSEIKEAVGDIMLNAKGEIETSDSKIVEHGEDAVGAFSKLLG